MSAVSSNRRLVRAIVAKASEDATTSLRVVQSLSKVIADEMQTIHGGTWNVNIDHDDQFILIVPEPK